MARSVTPRVTPIASSNSRSPTGRVTTTPPWYDGASGDVMRTTGTGGIHGVVARMLASATTHAYAARIDGCSARSSVAYDSGTIPCARSVPARMARVVAFGSIRRTRVPDSAVSHAGGGAVPTGSHGIGR